MTMEQTIGDRAMLQIGEQQTAQPIAIRVIRSTLRKYKVEILESNHRYRRGQITTVPRSAVIELNAVST